MNGSSSIRQEKKRGRPKEDDSDDRKPPPPSKTSYKRHRLLAETPQDASSAFPNFLLNNDVATEIFSFLDIRSLYNVTMTSKEGMKLLRHEHVVRSAMMQGGHSKTSMERLVPLIESRCIWIPSPLRMLRLVNGKRCERCSKERVHLVNDSFGVFFCFHGCIQGTSTKGVAFNNKWSPFLVNQPRIAKAAYSSSAYLWIRPYADAAGEPCGPLISMVEMERAMCGYGTVETLLNEKDAIDSWKDAVPEISRVFKDSTEAAERRIREKKEKKTQASVDANARRKEKIIAMIRTLQVELDDAPWKDIALSYLWIRSNSKEIPLFHCGLTNALMREYSGAPSKASKKKLKEVARSLRESFGVIEEKGLHDFSFLSSSDPVERVVKEYCLEHFPVPFEMFKNIDEAALSNIRGATTNTELLKDVLTQVWCQKHKSILTLLAPSIVSSTVAIQSDEMRQNAINQALRLASYEASREALFTSAYWTHQDRISARVSPYDLYSNCIEKYPILFQNTLDFLDAPETVAWIDDHLQAKYWDGPFDPKVAREKLESRVHDIWNYHKVVENMLKRDFSAVLKDLAWTPCGKFS